MTILLYTRRCISTRSTHYYTALIDGRYTILDYTIAICTNKSPHMRIELELSSDEMRTKMKNVLSYSRSSLVIV